MSASWKWKSYLHIPSEWRLANVTPIYKKGNRNLCSNYRPISLTSTCCKIAERVVKNCILSFLDQHKLISSTQHGFLPSRSCLSSLLCFLETVTRNIDQRIDISAIYIDFTKAFDSVPHGRLQYKLKSFGIDGALLEWIGNFLSDRKQRVVIRGIASSWAPVLSGVPQGSVLGPLLFVMFVDDIDSCLLHSTVSKYADDVKIISTVNYDYSWKFLQGDLNRLIAWANKWLLNINLDKCSVLHFGKHNTRKSLFIKDHPLVVKSNEKDLGVSITDNLKPSYQCHQASSSAQRILNLIRLTFYQLDIASFSHIYKAIVRPRLEYCIPAWSPYLQKDIIVLERVQRRATRMIPSLKTLTYQDRLKHFKMTSLSTRRLRFDLITTYKCLNGFLDVPYNHFFTFSKISNTRGHTCKLEVKFSHSSRRSSFFSQRVVHWWNMLPSECVTASTISSFKAQVDTFLQNNGFWWILSCRFGPFLSFLYSCFIVFPPFFHFSYLSFLYRVCR